MAELTHEESEVDQLAEELLRALTAEYGPILGSKALIKALGYPSTAAFEQALTRGTIPVPIFRIKHRRGSFALARDIALWLSQQRAEAFGQQAG